MKLGIKKIRVTKQNNISLPLSKENESVNIPDSVVWENLETTHLSGTLNESSATNEHGTLRTVSITAIAVDETAAVREQLRKLETGHIFIIEDMNGVEYLVGTNQFRSQLTYRHEINKFGKNIFTVEIRHQSPHGALRVFKIPTVTGIFTSYWSQWTNTYNFSQEGTELPPITVHELVGSYRADQMTLNDTLAIEEILKPDWIYDYRIIPQSELWDLPVFGKGNIIIKLFALPNYGAQRQDTVTLIQSETHRQLTVNCLQNTTVQPQSYIAVRSENYSFVTVLNLSTSVEGQQYSLYIINIHNENTGNWPVTNSTLPEWIDITINANFDAITIDVHQNTSGAERTALITLTQQISNATCSINITQITNA
jgi:hypothetical protein